MLIKTQELVKKELPNNDSEITIAVNVPGQGQFIFKGMKHFHLFIEEEIHTDKFGVQEIYLLNQEFERAVHGLSLRRLIDLVEGGLNIE